VQAVHLRKYGTATTLHFELYEPDGVDLKTDATFEAGDVKLMQDEGAEANTNSLPTDEGQGYSLALLSSEAECARGTIYIVDQTGTKGWLDRIIHFETYGHASAQHAFDLDAAKVAVSAIDPNVITADSLKSDAITAIRDAISGGAYALDTDANGRIRIVVGAGEGELDTSSGKVLLANGAHGGSAAVLTLERLIAISTTSGEPGIKVLGNGGGDGLYAKGGATGSGLRAEGGSSAGRGIYGIGSGGSPGIQGQGAGTGSGIYGYAPATGSGIRGLSAGGPDIMGQVASDALAAILAEIGIDLREAICLILAASVGKLSGAGTTTITIKGADNDTTRILATVDLDGNRTAVTLTPSS
jgi:hypothetical protein